MYGCLFMLRGSDAADGFRESKKRHIQKRRTASECLPATVPEQCPCLFLSSVDTHASAVNAGITLSELRCGNG